MRPARPALLPGHTGGRGHRLGHQAPAARVPGPTLLPRLALVATLLAGWPGSGAGQQQEEAVTGVVAGTVTGEDAAVLAGAEVRVAGSPLVGVTGEDGQFRIADVPGGAVLLEVRSMGYRAATFPIDVVAGLTLSLHLPLEIEPVRLDPVAVRARLSPELRGFYERRERGAGHFFTREEIGHMRTRLVTDVLRRVPGARVAPSAGRFGTGYVVEMRRTSGIAGARPCPVLYYVNGAPFSVPPDVGINHFIRADEIAGMEVYSGASQLPPAFHSSARGARCGVVLIWTHGGESRHPTR